MDGLFSADRDGKWDSAGDLLLVRPEQRLEPLLARASAARRDREGAAWRSLQLRVPGGVDVNPTVWLLAVALAPCVAAAVALGASPWLRGAPLWLSFAGRFVGGGAVGGAVWFAVTRAGRTLGWRTLREIVDEAAGRRSLGG